MKVSVLFSEPKIPQFHRNRCNIEKKSSFSALQRAENSSIIIDVTVCVERTRFSALQRAENSSMLVDYVAYAQVVQRFSALQRAENSSMPVRAGPERAKYDVSVLFSEPKIPQSPTPTPNSYILLEFQCSSASRKFLNLHDYE